MGRQYQDSVDVGMSPEVAMRSLCDSVANVAKPTSVRVDGWTVTGMVGVSIWSWGEHVEGRVQPSVSGAQVEVSSRCRAQLIDWGRNRRNVEQILRPFSGTTSPPQPRS